VNGLASADDWNGRGFVRRALRSTAIIGLLAALVLASYGQFWAIGPFTAGLALSGILLWALDLFVRGLLTPVTARRALAKGKGIRGPILLFSLIKYPLVGLLLYVAVRVWRGDLHRAAAFLSGFILLHLVIGLRAFGRARFGRGA